MRSLLTLPQTLRVELPLQLNPDQLVLTRLGEALPEEPDGGAVRHRIWVAEETLEADPVVSLPLHLFVAEAEPLLEDEELDHHHLIGVWSSASLGVVSVEVFYDRSEGGPVYLGVCFGEFVA